MINHLLFPHLKEIDMSNTIEFLNGRESSAVKNINRISNKIQLDKHSPNIDDLCIYITGSYGRLEASPHSDLDLFFIRNGSKEDNKISNVDKALLDANIIKSCKMLKFPEFTKGGIYLKIHYLDDVIESLGNPNDDYHNFFTARMLLLLESRPILNEAVFKNAINEIIDTYFRDYHRHEKDFEPVFLVNDIRRFWLTLCLNYEHNRKRKNETISRIKNKVHLKNLKLKFSRLLTCYSMIAGILSLSGAISPEEIIRLVRLTPQQRIREIGNTRPELSELVMLLLDDYAWFLNKTGQTEDDVIKWIGRRKNRNVAFEKAREFSKKMNDLIIALPEDRKRLRYLLI